MKSDTYTKKIRPNRSVLVKLRGCGVILNMTKKSYLLTLNPVFLSPGSLLEKTQGVEGVFLTY